MYLNEIPGLWQWRSKCYSSRPTLVLLVLCSRKDAYPRNRNILLFERDTLTIDNRPYDGMGMLHHPLYEISVQMTKGYLYDDKLIIAPLSVMP